MALSPSEIKLLATGTAQVIREQVGPILARLDALDGLGTKSAKPRVRVPARGLGFKPAPGDAYQTKDMSNFWLKGHRDRPTGDVYETTDGVTFRLVRG